MNETYACPAFHAAATPQYPPFPVEIQGVLAYGEGMEETDAAPISQAEMVEMFGETMPIEAVRLLFESPGSRTIGELRAKLREIARARKAP